MKRILKNLLKKEPKDITQSYLGWLEEADKLTSADRLKLCIKHITSILSDKEIALNDKIDLVFKIDEFNVSSIQSQINSFSGAENLKPNIANNIVNSHYAYARILFLAYSKLIDQSVNQPTDHQPDNETIALLLTRTIKIASIMLKWRHFDRASAPMQLWLQANNLYKTAEQQVVTNQPVTPYKDSKETTFEKEYLALLLMGSFNHNSLHNHQIELIATLLPEFVSNIRVESKLEKYHSFYMNLDKDNAVARVRKQAPTGHCIFWDLDEAEHQIDVAIKDLNTHKTTQLLDALGIKSNRTHLDTLSFIKKEWSKTGYIRQRRKQTRESQDKTVSATFAIKTISALIKNNQNAQDSAKGLLDGTLSDRRISTSITTRENIHTIVVGNEKWLIKDESALGLGSMVEGSSNLKPNKLVAISDETTNTKVALGVIRNIKQLTGGKLKTGIEILSDKPYVTVFKKFESKTAEQKEDKVDSIESLAELQKRPFDIIYIPQNLLTEAPASLILPKLNFIPNSFYELTYKNKHEIVKVTEIMESGDDWVRVAFPEELD